MSKISNISQLKFIKNIGVSCFLQNTPNNYYSIIKESSDRDFKSNSKNSNLNQIKKFILDIKNKKKESDIIIQENNLESKIMVIGECLRTEDLKAKNLFSGKAGELLTKMLNAINLNKNKIYFCNIIPWVLPKNHETSNEEILMCLPLTQKIIELVKPKIILLLGSTASKAILNSNINLENLRGEFHNYKSINLNNEIKCMSTYHPEFLLDFPNFKKNSWSDLKKFKEKINNENI